VAGRVALDTRSGEVAESLEEQLGLDLLAAEAEGALLLNFLRRLHGSWTGHWAVVGGVAFGDAQTYVLILDVAAHKAGPHWVPLPLLVRCICTLNSHGVPRGYLRMSSTPEANLGHSVDEFEYMI
jgi:hypothetical protein